MPIICRDGTMRIQAAAFRPDPTETIVVEGPPHNRAHFLYDVEAAARIMRRVHFADDKPVVFPEAAGPEAERIRVG